MDSYTPALTLKWTNSECFVGVSRAVAKIPPDYQEEVKQTVQRNWHILLEIDERKLQVKYQSLV